MGVAYDLYNKGVYIANEGSSTVSVINATTHQVAGNPITGESRPNSLAYNSNNGRMYVVNYADGIHGTVSVIDTLTNTLVDTISVGSFPQGIAYDSDNGEMYVSNFDSGTVSVIATIQYPSHTTITSAVDGNGNPVQNGGSAISTSITFNVQATSGTNPITGFQCSLDNNTFTSCGNANANPITVTYNNLQPGQHIFKVRSVDSQNNVDLTSATFSWLVVQPPTNTTITSAKDGNGNSVSNGGSTTSASITFTVQATPGTNPITGFQCSLDGSSYLPCNGTFSNNMETITYNSLVPGPQHTFKVRTVDNQGNVDPTPASFSWTVVQSQQQPPTNTTITSAKDGNGNPVSNGGSTLSTSITFTVQATAGSNPIAGFQCSLDNAPSFSSCGTASSNNGQGTITLNNLAAGQQHSIKIRAVDTQGNVDPNSVTFRWTIMQQQQPPPLTHAQEIQQKIRNLLSEIDSIPNLSIFIKSSLESPLKVTITLLNNNNNHQTVAAACFTMKAFLQIVNINENAGHLSHQQAAELKQQAVNMQKAMGCFSLHPFQFSNDNDNNDDDHRINNNNLIKHFNDDDRIDDSSSSNR
jgi:YVTN family beta-propeller protein